MTLNSIRILIFSNVGGLHWTLSQAAYFETAGFRQRVIFSQKYPPQSIFGIEKKFPSKLLF